MNPTSTLKKFFSTRLIALIIIFFILSTIAVLAFFSNSHKRTVQNHALENAKVLSRILKEFRTIYTSEVINTLEKSEITITHDYKNIPHAVPLPATLSMLLGNSLRAENSEVQSKLYSPYPFPWRKETGGLKDPFAVNAWKIFQHNSDTIIFEFVQLQSKPFLRYATADIMRPACVTCHNTHPQTPSTEWKVGDVRGILEVQLPLEGVTQFADQEYKTINVLIGLIFIIGLIILWQIGRRINQYKKAMNQLFKESKDTATKLKTELEERIKAEVELKESEERFRKIIDLSMDAVVVMDMSGAILEFNEKAEIIFDCDAKEAFSKNFFSTFIADETRRTDFLNAMQLYAIDQSNAHMIQQRIELEATTLDGVMFPIEIAITGLEVWDEWIFGTFIRDITERKQAENKLKSSEEKFRTLFENAPEAIVIYDLIRQKIVSVNPVAEELFEYTKDEFLNLGPADISPEFQPDGRASSEKAEMYLRETAEGGTPVFEWTHQTKSGVDFYTEVRLVKIPSQEDMLVRGSITDITARKLTEQSLKESEQRYQLFTEITIEAIVVVHNNMIVDINPAFTTIFGYDIAEILNTEFYKLISEKSHTNLASFENGMKHDSFELYGIHKDGSLIPLVGEARLFPYRGKDMYVFVFYDISEIKQAQKEILYRSAFENLLTEISTTFVNISYTEVENYILKSIEVICLFTGTEVGFVYISEPNSTKVNLRYTWVQDDIEIDLTPFTHFDMKEMQWWFKVFRSEQPVLLQNLEKELPDKEGSGKSLLVKAGVQSLLNLPLSYQNKVIGSIGLVSISKERAWSKDDVGLVKMLGQVFINAIQRKEKEEELKESYELLEQRVEERTAQLQEKNDQLKDFAYTVSHDLKSPLRGIVGYAQELEAKHKTGMEERAQFCVNQVISATQNLERLIEDLLHYSRLDTQEQTFNTFNIKVMIENILKDRQKLIEDYQTELHLEIESLNIVGWKLGISQVLSNLIDNAIKYSRKNKHPKVEIYLKQNDETFTIRVKDNGIGFREKYKERLFGLFNRLVRQDEFEGTGAGLAICKKVIDKLGGTLDASSVYKENAEFWFTLPKNMKNFAN